MTNPKANMILIMIDECGSEIEYDSYTIGDDLDEDYIELWKMQKITEAEKSYPEARFFYFEDRRDWNQRIAAMVRDDSYEEVYD